MDPFQTWTEMMNLWRDGEQDQAIYVGTDLVDWLNKGGSYPRVFITDNVERINQTLKMITNLMPDCGQLKECPTCGNPFYSQ